MSLPFSNRDDVVANSLSIVTNLSDVADVLDAAQRIYSNAPDRKADKESALAKKRSQ